MQRRGLEGSSAREHLVERDAKRVDVGAMVGRWIAGRLLGRHVRRRADDGAELRERPSGRDAVRDALIALAMPKSVTTAVPPERRMFSGLMSRCTTPCSCAYASALRDVAQNADRLGDRRAVPSPAARGAISPATNGIV